ncbi:unnamed protein product [Rhizoctonia solani]|uniref:Transmembrane protein 66 n=1 Tax=Rhizoctonia solani TaxID=456999 RepID=A0A8H2XNS7_9AGAM|nr:unnamed protein product [Rhizoctonia solani]
MPTNSPDQEELLQCRSLNALALRVVISSPHLYTAPRQATRTGRCAVNSSQLDKITNQLRVWVLLSGATSARLIYPHRYASANCMYLARDGSVRGIRMSLKDRGLTYSLVRTPSGNYYGPSAGTDYTTYVLYIVAVLLALYILITWLRPNSSDSRSGRSWGSGTPGGGRGNGGGGWPWGTGGGRGGGPNSSNDAPPPYSKHARPSQPHSNESWRPGFWTGLGAGGLATGMYNYLTRPRDTYRPAATAWDWDRASSFSSTGPYRPEPSAFRRRHDHDSGAGSSTGPGTQLGEMRRATGYAGTSVR